MRIINTRETPPTKWEYTQFETGHRFYEPDFDALVDAVRKHRVSNLLERSSLKETYEDIEDQICHRSPSHVCKGADFEPSNLSASTVFHAMTALAETWKNVELVELNEAERRADLCRRCPMNQPSKGCFGRCADAFRDLFISMNRGRTTAHDDSLSSCEICGCSNQATVHFPLSVLHTDRQHYFDRVPHCWRRSVDTNTQQG